jgi:glycosyltransferase involved in cell wall biosynthesis
MPPIEPLTKLPMPAAPSEPLKTSPGAGVGPLVSVGIPVYNGELFLRGAVDSILAQSHRNLDVIISDNASIDATAEICREYVSRDPRVRYVRQERNIGAARNWSFVARCARGKYMKWQPANDYCDPGLVAACVAVLEADPRVVLCFGKTHLVEEATGAVQPYDGDFSLTEERPSERLSCVMEKLRLNNAVTGVIRTDVLKMTGLHRPYPGGDLVHMAELALAGKFVLLPNPISYRRIGARTFSGLLTDAQLAHFIDPLKKSGFRSGRARMNLDYFMSVLRAKIPIGEKRRALALVARNAYWDAAKTMTRPQHPSGVRR